MRAGPRAVLVVSVVLLAACGQVTPIAGPTSSPSPSAQPPPLAISSLTFPAAEVGVPVRPFTVGASGGLPPYQWTVAAGTFPGGMRVASGGAVSGTPAAAGTFKFTLQVTDLAAKSAWIDVSMIVVPALTVKPVKTGTIVIERGKSPGAFASQSGGNPPYAYTLKSGTPPPGTTLSALALAGAPTATGSYSFSVTVTDSFGVTASVSPSYLVFAPLAFPSPPTGQPWDATCSGTIVTGCFPSVPYTGGYPGTTPQLTWYAAAIDGTRTPCVPPAYTGVCELGTPYVSGGAVHVPFPRETPRVPGPIGWTGQVVLVLTDPVTGEKTRAAHVRIAVVFSY